MAGYVQLDRKILKWEWYDDANTFRLFVHLLLTCNHKNAKWHGQNVLRGQVVTGRLKLAAVLGLSEMQIRTSLNKLKSTGEITMKTTSQNSIITICKYDTYQSNKNEDNQQDNQQNNQQITNEQPTSNQRVTTNNNDNNDNNSLPVIDPEKYKFWFLKIYHSNYETYKSVFNGQSTTEEYFLLWKEFIDFIYEKKYDELFECKFLNPHDFAKMVRAENFTKEFWDEPLKQILATGVEPKHNLFFRIPQFIKIVNKQKKENAKSINTTKLGTSEARTEGLRGWGYKAE